MSLLKTKTILVVDDEPSVLASIGDMLTPLGCRTILAATGEEALEITGEFDGEIDLLMTDVVLPAMKGHELAKQFLKRYPETKILYMSGYFSPAISADELLYQEKAFIQKPFLMKELLRVTERLLDKRKFLRE